MVLVARSCFLAPQSVEHLVSANVLRASGSLTPWRDWPDGLGRPGLGDQVGREAEERPRCDRVLVVTVRTLATATTRRRSEKRSPSLELGNKGAAMG